jgi:hypothetical protein
MGELTETGTAAVKAGISRERVVRLIQKGEVKGSRTPRGYLVDLDDLLRCLRKEKPPSEGKTA